VTRIWNLLAIAFSPSTSNRKARLGVEAALGGAKVPVSLAYAGGREGQGALPPDGKASAMKVEQR